jgi:UDP-glucose 4-epimerase
MQGRKIVITGGAGFIGSQLGYLLHKQGNDVVLLDNLSFGYEDNLLVENKAFGKFVKMDIMDPDLHAQFKDADCVFHFAGISSLPSCQSDPCNAFSINAAGTANVLEAARKTDVRRVVFASTGAIYENNNVFPCKEDDAVDPKLAYAVSKKNAETICKSFEEVYGMEIAITRYFNVYGPNQDIRRKSPPFVGYVIRELMASRPPILHSDGEQKRDYVYIDDVNVLNILCMNHPGAAGEIFNVASCTAYSVNEIYDLIAKHLNSQIRPIFNKSAMFWEKYPSLYEGKFPLKSSVLENEVNKYTLGSAEKAKKILEWSAQTPIEDGLKRVIEHSRMLQKNEIK